MNQQTYIAKIEQAISENFTSQQMEIITEYLNYMYVIGYERGWRERTIRNKRKVLQIKNGKILNIFESASEAARSGWHFNRTCVADVCRGRRKTYKGYKWAYAENYYNQKSNL